MRIFISHKQEDATTAVSIAGHLRGRGIPCYVDVLDDQALNNPERLTQHLQGEIKQSTHLLAVVSLKTQSSWWVPFEIGVAQECGHAISSFLLQEVKLPGYLVVWPYLRTIQDLDTYVQVVQSRQESFEKYARKSASDRRLESHDFHQILKRRLGQ